MFTIFSKTYYTIVFLFGGVEKHRLGIQRLSAGGSELGDCLGALRDGMLGKLTRKKQTNCSLDLPRRQGRLLRVSRELRGLESEALEDVVDEGVHNGHASLADAGLGMDLLQYLVDVRRVGLNALLVRLGASLLGGLGGFLPDSWCLGHDLRSMVLCLISNQL